MGINPLIIRYVLIAFSLLYRVNIYFTSAK